MPESGPTPQPESAGPIPPTQFGKSWTFAATVGLVLSLSFASFDLILCVVFVPLRSLADPAMTTTFFAGTVVAILPIYALLWLLIGLPLRFLLKLPVLSLSVGLASGLALPVFTTIMSDGSWELKELLSPYYLTVSLGVMVGVGLLV